MLIALSVGAAELWRWKDADGVMHYSDRPVPGAERIDVLSAQKTTDAVTPTARPETVAPAPQIKYTRCEVIEPKNDQVFMNVRAVQASIAVEPELQGDFRLQVLLNGSPAPGWPPGAYTHTFVDLFRGSYTLAVRVLDADGRPACAGPVVNFHVRLPSVLAPGRKPPAKKP